MTTVKARVGILGAGAMGTLFAYLLADDYDVTLVDIRGDLVETISEQGVIVDDLPPRHVRATCDSAKAVACQFLFVFVKATDTLRAVRPFAGQLNPATPIISLQNGLGNEEAIKTALGGSVPLVLGVTTEACVSTGHGRSHRLGIGTTVLGSAGASPATLQSVSALLGGVGLAARTVYDIRPHLWGKLLANAAINPIAALLDSKNAVIPATPDAAELARAIAYEGAAVAKALKISLPFTDAWEYVKGVIASSADGRNSMTIDLAARRKTEIDYINGAIVAAGRRTGVPTPYNESLWRIIKAREHVAAD
jgi:2-dehydropantoate 2-reductase